MSAHSAPKFKKGNYSSLRQKLLKGHFTPINQRPKFDIPIAFNKKVQYWISYFQTRGKSWFNSRLGRANRYFPIMTQTLRRKNLPLDLTYIAMIESGFSAKATSSANAVGYWQFIKPTAKQYGLKINWWLDERQDFVKSTTAAANYLGDLYKIFNSWYLAAAAYNMGEGRLKALIKRHHTKNFWVLSQKRGFPRETREYIPKLLATMIIAKAPQLYGFNNIKNLSPHSYQYFFAKGGSSLLSIAKRIKISPKKLGELNPALKFGFIPKNSPGYYLRVPNGKISSL